MTTQLLATELANLIQESKRKHNDLRQAAEKSLEELKRLGNGSETAAPEQLAQKPNFVNPFIIACGTKNAKFTGIAIVCLQRLIVARALPRSKLNQILDALMQASSAGLDVQLKILQALPSLLQNYSEDLQGELLVTALNICFVLQSSKNAIVNNTSAATLQQLVVAVFDKVVAEDSESNESFVGEAPTADGVVKLRTAALDAYRIFNDLCLLTENQRPEFIRFSGLPQTFGLELIESVITNHGSILSSHPEQVQVLRVRVMPLLLSALKGKPTFSTSVRLVRIIYTILRRHITLLPSESGEALEILTHLLDQDIVIWKRALCMEVFRGIFAEHALVRRIYGLYDAKEAEKKIFKTLVATFVRLSTEKPAVIGLGHQSSMPTVDASNNAVGSSDQAMLEASGLTGIISSSGPSELSNIGISVQWSSVRTPCIDQLDKTEPPAIPESYIYSLILACISSLSDGLAKFILPLTVPSENKGRRKGAKEDVDRGSSKTSELEADSPMRKGRLERSGSFKKNPVFVNPLQLDGHPLHGEVKLCSSLVDECWPAILATCSTFLFAALDTEYYHGLVRAFQRFTHVAGLLQLSTPRDAFLTTLGKSAVPSNVLSASLTYGQIRSQSLASGTEPPSTPNSNAKGLLNIESLTPGASSLEKQRQASSDSLLVATLNTRNLLCLRALLNLGIALGSTLGQSWSIILETLQQADLVLFVTGRTPGRTPTVSRGHETSGDADGGSLMANFSNEVRSVETAASRLIDSTIDFPNQHFVEVVGAVCNLLEREANVSQLTENSSQSPLEVGDIPPSPRPSHRRVLSFSNQSAVGSNQEFLFALAKLGELASTNIDRLLSYDAEESGWKLMVHRLVKTLTQSSVNSSVRIKAAEVLARLSFEFARATSSLPVERRGDIQLRILSALLDALLPLHQNARQISVAGQSTDIEVHRMILEGLRSILEDCGESLVDGWDLIFEMIGTVFVPTLPTKGEAQPPTTSGSLRSRSSKLVRSSFASLQLICSDFLTTLPNSCFIILVDTLCKFSSQDDDLNIALTTVTFFWAVSDFLSSKSKSLVLTSKSTEDSEAGSLVRIAADSGAEHSTGALWMLLLLRLTAVSTDDRLELRNSAIQTLLRIFDAYGDRLGPESWSICIKFVVFKLLSSLRETLNTADDSDVEDEDRNEWYGTAVVVLDGISRLLANNLDVLTSHSSFNQLWRELLGHLAGLLDFEVLSINTATFKAFSHVLSQSSGEKPIFNEVTVNFAWDLWARGVPKSKSAGGKEEDNQECLIAYVGALREVYRLVQNDLTLEKVECILRLLRRSTIEATAIGYTPDIENMTRLQTQIVGAIEMIRTDISGVPGALLVEVSKLATLAYEDSQLSASIPRRTFVALSKASMGILEGLVLKHVTDKDIYEQGAFCTLLNALNRPVALKYGFPIVTKSDQPWRTATSTALAVLEATLPRLHGFDISPDAYQDIWSATVRLADSILSADCAIAPANTDLDQDEQFDIAAFHKLRTLLIPALGSKRLADDTRNAYAKRLFRTSIIHTLHPADESIASGDKDGGLSALYESRHGRTESFIPIRRTKIAYVAFGELFCLVSSDSFSSSEAERTVNSKKPADEHHEELYTKIATTVAPLVIVRCALTLRAYVADQPLRGQMPQPLSQRKELLWMLQKLVTLTSIDKAIPNLKGAKSEGRKHLLRLYPLLVKSLAIGSDGKVQSLLRDALDVIGGELGIV